ncbi:phosphate regulon sensor histidine kinase PhoR [Ralstonia pseudosolanacearum]|uniref:Phosphate regulon sensor protein PhoR n=1 Tax=Ralstonia solanacearum TaxID=305 RepID=A0A0S4TX38_RALSL|nr:phosphate regulon sensor histidine kinase PhoR [Ralstonia pseudosolanacearum]OAI80535.1 histidine kinase [Ralstonia solanacearum]QCX49314.1 phosphate regulon sensor histidine kinase PhoR [Ralstonia pseudosolanacearum]CUV14594.1 Phosphate regulon sensor protein PhoR [Ralstonia solanacearum]
MNIIWTRFVFAVALMGLVTLGLYFFVGHAVAFAAFSAMLLTMLLYYVYQLQRLWRVLESPAYGEIPSALGLWGEVYYRLHRLMKGWRTQVLQVEQQHSRFIQAIQASPNGVLMLDGEDQIEWCNAVAEEHFGLSAKRDLRQRITHLIRRPEFVRYLARGEFEEPLTMRDMGPHKQSIVSAQVLPYGEDRKLLVSQDITKLENTESMRRDFVANVSHELKTPLTVLSGFLETVRDLPLSEDDKRRYLDMMHVQATRMQHLVEDLLALATLEGNSEPPSITPVPMQRVMLQLQHDAEALSAGRHAISMTCDASVSVCGAELELLSAFSNLVSNAIRYTPDGGRISLDWSARGGHAVFSVTDTGIGIAPEHIPRLTERFYRVDRSRSRDTGGTGLGLAIVKHVLSRHGADLQVASERGKGSTFRASFPPERTVVRGAGGAGAERAA